MKEPAESNPVYVDLIAYLIVTALALAIVAVAGCLAYWACKSILRKARGNQHLQPGVDRPFGIDQSGPYTVGEWADDNATQEWLNEPVTNHPQQWRGERPISMEELDRRWPHMSGDAQWHMRGQGYLPPEERARKEKLV